MAEDDETERVVGPAVIDPGPVKVEDNSLGRLLTLADGIFAIAMTLLVLDLKIPDNPHESLTKQLGDQSGSYLAFLISFYVVATYWLSYEYVRNPRKYTEQQAMSDALARGCYQVLSLVGPYLRGDTRLLFEKLSEEYLKKLKQN